MKFFLQKFISFLVFFSISMPWLKNINFRLQRIVASVQRILGTRDNQFQRTKNKDHKIFNRRLNNPRIWNVSWDLFIAFYGEMADVKLRQRWVSFNLVYIFLEFTALPHLNSKKKLWFDPGSNWGRSAC